MLEKYSYEEQVFILQQKIQKLAINSQNLKKDFRKISQKYRIT